MIAFLSFLCDNGIISFHGGCKGKMRKYKRTPLKILIVVMFAGIVGIVSMLLQHHNVQAISASYTRMSDELYECENLISQLSSCIYEHQYTVAMYAVASSEEDCNAYLEEATLIREQISSLLEELGSHRMTDSYKALYLDLSINTHSYLDKTNPTFLTNIKSINTAGQFVASVLPKYVNKINESLVHIQNDTGREMEAAEGEIDTLLRYTVLCDLICLAGIVVAAFFAIFFCVRLTSRLAHSRDELENEVDHKTLELLEHSERMLSIQNNTIMGMATLIENRDGETGEHIRRTSMYVELLAKAAQKDGYSTSILTDRYIELTVKAAPMHDIGKIAVPDQILKKPGRLTDEEFEIMKRHAAEGGRIVREVLENIEDNEYVNIASKMAEFHHEKWNGSGYPHGCQALEIPLCARIMAIADVFDALVSKRCYKRALSLDEAFDIIRESSGTHFDPDLVRIFLTIRKSVERAYSCK